MKENLLKIINHYGVVHQQRKLNEEVFELQEAIINRNLHWNYDTEIQDMKPLNEHIKEEIADVLNVVEQFIYFYEIDVKELIEIKHYKVNRQLERMKEEK
ncbi:MAG: hypothetical protein J6Q96_01100 [Bacteroidales bacterium]|nr:hypothetical protein [Bacteroidales bacterium]